jgi:hypothetical protein
MYLQDAGYEIQWGDSSAEDPKVFSKAVSKKL